MKVRSLRSKTEEFHLSNIEFWPVLAIAILALGLRLLFLGNKSFWYDEAASYRFCLFDSARFHALIWQHELNMSAYYVLLRGWLHLGTSEFMIRLLSVIPSVATVPVVYALGRRLFSRRVAVLASLLLALHSAHVAYAQEARGYSLAGFLTAISSLFFVRMLGYSAEQAHDTWETRTYRRQLQASTAKEQVENGSDNLHRDFPQLDSAFYAISSAAAIYAHFFAILVIAAQWLSLLGYRGKLHWRRLMSSAVALGCFLAPVVWFLSKHNDGQLSWIPPLSAVSVLKVIAMLSGHAIAVPIYLVLWVIAVRQIVHQRDKIQRVSWASYLVVSWLVLPFALIVVASLNKPVLHPRFLTISIPAAVLLAAVGLARFRDKRTIAVGIAMVISLAGVIHYYTLSKEDWRGASNYVIANSQPGDVLIIVPDGADGPYDYYQQRSPALQRPALEQPSALTASPRRFWLMLYNPGNPGTQGEAELRQVTSLRDRGYHLLKCGKFKKLEVSLYESGAGR